MNPYQALLSFDKLILYKTGFTFGLPEIEEARREGNSSFFPRGRQLKVHALTPGS